MKSGAALLAAVLLIAGCTATPDVSQQTGELNLDDQPTTSLSDEPRLSSPKTAEDPLSLRDVSVSTTTYEIAFDEGSGWEMPLRIAVPEGWVFDPEAVSFSDGSSSIVLTAGCAGACESKDWSHVLNGDDEFLGLARASLPEGRMQAGGGASDLGQTETLGSASDDGSGISSTAHFRSDVGRFLGCTATASPGSIALDQLTALCKQLRIDWSVAAANTPAISIIERLSDDAVAALADPARGLDRESFSVDGKGMITIAVPLGATVSEDGDEIELGDTESIFTDIDLDATCDGICEPQDWAVLLQEPRNTLGALRLRLDLVNDSPIDDGWLISGTRSDGDHTVLVTRWSDGASRFFVCRATIDDRDAGFIDDALNICLSAEPDWSTW